MLSWIDLVDSTLGKMVGGRNEKDNDSGVMVSLNRLFFYKNSMRQVRLPILINQLLLVLQVLGSPKARDLAPVMQGKLLN